MVCGARGLDRTRMLHRWSSSSFGPRLLPLRVPPLGTPRCRPLLRTFHTHALADNLKSADEHHNFFLLFIFQLEELVGSTHYFRDFVTFSLLVLITRGLLQILEDVLQVFRDFTIA